MTTSAVELFGLATALVLGAAIGAAYFTALWRTVQHMAVSQHRWRWYLTSLLVRTSIAGAALAAAGLNHPARMAVAVLGFAIGRYGVVRFTRDAHESDRS